MTITPGRPAYVQVAADLRHQIRTGMLPVGAQLPSMAQLSATYSVSSTVIRDALSELRRDGLIVGQQGKGVFVQQADGASVTPAGDDLRARMDEVAAMVRRIDERVTRLESTVEQPNSDRT